MNSGLLARAILPLSVIVLSSLACQAVTDFVFEDAVPYTSDEPAFVISSVENEPEIASVPGSLLCPAVTDEILSAATGFYEDDSSVGDSEEPEQVYLVTYTVVANQISNPYLEDAPTKLTGFQADQAGHQEIWDYFITLIPAEKRNLLAEFSIVTDGDGNLLAAVSQTLYDPALWVLEVDIHDSADRLNLTYTLIHEYAHLLTLGPDQVSPSKSIFNNPDDDDIYYNEASGCPDYFPGEGCSISNSYINVFFNKFWADIHDEWQDINLIEDDNAYYEALDDFYYNYEDRFVTQLCGNKP